jgi:hypothetical protein
VRGRTRTLLAAVVAIAAVVAAVLVLRLGGGDGEACMRQLVPAYFAPGAPDGWDALLAETPRGVATVIVNPASGPGAAPDPGYRQVVDAARAGDIDVVGYVHTRFGSRPAAEVEADAGRYREWYGVDGVFLDEASSDAAQLPYYRELRARLDEAGDATVILNPGRVPDEGYMAAADVVVTFEGTSAAYAGATFPGWLAGYGAERFAHLVYAAGGAPPGSVERLAASRHTANVHVTDDDGANPWDRLPATYADAVARLAGCGVAVGS